MNTNPLETLTRERERASERASDPTAMAHAERLSAGSIGDDNTMMKKMKSEVGTKDRRERITLPLPWLLGDDSTDGRRW